jgi:hypothetical protein
VKRTTLGLLLLVLTSFNLSCASVGPSLVRSLGEVTCSLVSVSADEAMGVICSDLLDIVETTIRREREQRGAVEETSPNESTVHVPVYFNGRIAGYIKRAYAPSVQVELNALTVR